MPVWPPQNTGIFDYKIPGGGPQMGPNDLTTPLSGGFWLRPVTPFVCDNSGPVKTSYTTPTLEFTPVGAQGSSLTLIRAALQTSGATVTQVGPFSFTVTLTLPPFPPHYQVIMDNLIVQYQDEDGNMGYGCVAIGTMLSNGSVTMNFVAGLSSPFTASATAPATATTNSQNVTTPNPLPGAMSNWALAVSPVQEIELSPSFWILEPLPSPANQVPGSVNAFYLDSAGNPPKTPYFQQTSYAVAMVSGTSTHLGVQTFWYTDFQPVTVTITGNPYSK